MNFEVLLIKRISKIGSSCVEIRLLIQHCVFLLIFSGLIRIFNGKIIILLERIEKISNFRDY